MPKNRVNARLLSVVAVIAILLLVGCADLSAEPANGPAAIGSLSEIAVQSPPSHATLPIRSTVPITPTVLFDETLDGDLPNDPSAPEQFVLGLGTFLLTVTSTFEDPDYFALVVPDNVMIESITLNSYAEAVDSPYTTVSIQNGAEFTNPSSSTPNDEIDSVGMIIFDGDDEQFGVNLLNRLFIIGDDPCFKGPILSGTYAIRVRGSRGHMSTYSLALTVTEGPQRTLFPITAAPDDAGQQRSACSNIEWREEDLTAFSLLLPADMVKEDVEGTDSFVGQYNRDGMTLSFDYGWYSNPLNSFCDQPEYQESQIELSGKPARIISFSNENHLFDPEYTYVAGLYVPTASEEYAPGAVDKLQANIQFNDAENKAMALCILESVRFPE